MKNKKGLKIALIIIGILSFIFIIGSIAVSSIASKISEATEVSMYFNEYEVKKDNLASQVKCTGEITSFKTN